MRTAPGHNQTIETRLAAAKTAEADGNVFRAERLYEELLSEGSETSFCLGRLLNSYSAQSRVDQAGELCLRHAELISADAGLNFLSGKIFMQLGLTRKAFEYLSKAIALEPSLDGAEMELLFLADHGKFLSEVDVLRVRLRYGIND